MGFDAAQLGHDGIGVAPQPGSPQLAYAIQSANNLTASTSQQSFVFLPTCYHHTILGIEDWLKISVQGVTLIEALRDFMEGNSVHLIDQCNEVGCNPTCP